jgi:DNA polymerase V
MSRRMMAVLYEHAPRQQIYSIDECFLDITGLPDREQRARRMRADVLQRVGIPNCVGIGSSKTLAKLANHVAKKQKRWDGVFDWDWLTPTDREAMLGKIEVGEVWGIGRRLAERLARLNIRTALDLQQADPGRIGRQFCIVVERTVMELNGESCLSLAEVEPPKQQIISSRSFSELTQDLDTLSASIAHHAARASEKLRGQHSTALEVCVFITTNRFREQDAQTTPWVCMPLIQPSNDTILITHMALMGLRAIYLPGFNYKKAGVLLRQISSDRVMQSDLFAAPVDPHRERLMSTLDAINRNYGHGALHLGAEGLGHDWQMRQEARSPRYTTNIDELMKVH